MFVEVLHNQEGSLTCGNSLNYNRLLELILHSVTQLNNIIAPLKRAAHT